MRNYVALATILFLAGVGVAAWLLPDLRGWDDLALRHRLPVATLIIGLLALAAALVTILAALAEVRQVFPEQTIRVHSTKREFTNPVFFNRETFQLIFENPRDSSIINASRIDVRLVDSPFGAFGGKGWRSVLFYSDTADWRLQPSCKISGYSLGAEYLPDDDDVAIEIPIREAPSLFGGTWMPLTRTFSRPVGTDDLVWEFERENPWFPGVLVQGPEVMIMDMFRDYRWIVTWWTDRQGPVELVLDPF